MTFYVLFQWSYNSVIGTSPGNPGDAAGAYGTVIQVAMDTSGGNPWQGGTDDDGADAKGSPVWAADGGNLLVFPRGNGLGGTFATNKEALATAAFFSANGRHQVVINDDYFWVASDRGNDGGYNEMVYFGPYTPSDGITPDAAYIMAQNPNQSVTTTQGTTANSSQSADGAVAHPDSARGVRSFRYDRLAQLLADSNHQPNPVRGEYDAVPPTIMLYDSQGAGTYGAIGTLDNMPEVNRIATHQTNGARTRVAIGGTSSTTIKWFPDWDGETQPGSGSSRDGIEF